MGFWYSIGRIRRWEISNWLPDRPCSNCVLPYWQNPEPWQRLLWTTKERSLTTVVFFRNGRVLQDRSRYWNHLSVYCGITPTVIPVGTVLRLPFISRNRIPPLRSKCPGMKFIPQNFRTKPLLCRIFLPVLIAIVSSRRREKNWNG